MKIVKWLVTLILAAVVIVLGVVIFQGGAVIRQGVNRVGPSVLGVPVALDGAKFSPFQGLVQMNGLAVGNPDGFTTGNMFYMDDLAIDLDVRSLFSDTVVINHIQVDGPQINYEAGSRGTNLGVLLAKLQPDAERDADAKAKPGKGVVIKELSIVNAQSRVSATVLQGRGVTIQIPPITLTNLGGEDQDTAQIVAEVVRAVIIIVMDTVADEEGLLTGEMKDAFKEIEALRGTAEGQVRAMTDAVRDGARAVRGILGRDRDE